MLKKVLMLFIAFALSMGVAFAAVDVNTADQSALESVKGLGPVKSKAIVDERAAHGPFKNADDLADRVKGLGAKSVTNLENAGLTIGGSSAPPTGASKRAAPAPVQRSGATPTPSSVLNTNTGAPAGSTIKTTPAATGATSPAATTETTPAARSLQKRASKSAAGSTANAEQKASAVTAATAATAATATTASGASESKAKKTRTRKAKTSSDAVAP